MSTFLTSRTIAFATAGGFAAALFVSGVAQAVTDTIFKYSAAKTGWYAISAMQMVPANAQSANIYAMSWPDELNGTGECFSTGVHLPHGATITALTAWSTSNSGGGSHFYLYRAQLEAATSDVIVGMTPSDASGMRKAANKAVTANNLVDNHHYAYGFGLCMTTADQFAGARVTYTYTNAGD